MNIELNPKYEIGQRINEKTIIDEELVETKNLIIDNIKITYDYLSKELKYTYLLKFDDETQFIYGWFEL